MTLEEAFSRLPPARGSPTHLLVAAKAHAAILVPAFATFCSRNRGARKFEHHIKQEQMYASIARDMVNCWRSVSPTRPSRIVIGLGNGYDRKSGRNSPGTPPAPSIRCLARALLRLSTDACDVEVNFVNEAYTSSRDPINCLPTKKGLKPVAYTTNTVLGCKVPALGLTRGRPASVLESSSGVFWGRDILGAKNILRRLFLQHRYNVIPADLAKVTNGPPTPKPKLSGNPTTLFPTAHGA